ncbi:hypothetical protein BSKO_10841 [Bryopsis sp. KO-2023]|nr:hypothetical protein BSKO_10841 [Bryopsis sp. KO-2023]
MMTPEQLCEDEIVPIVRTAWKRAIGGDVDESMLDCVCESITADIVEDGIPETSEQAMSRFEGHLLECSPVESEELSNFTSIVLEKIDCLILSVAEEEDDLLEPGMCEMCERTMKLTRHHLIPKAMHNRWKAKGFSRETLNTCAKICRGCHSAVHHFFTERELAENFFTVDRLLQSEDLVRHARWANRQPVRTMQKRKIV